MEGKYFVHLAQDGRMIGQGQVTGRVGSEHYSVLLPGQPPVTQVLPASIFAEGFVLFDTVEDMVAWLDSQKNGVSTAPGPGKPLEEIGIKELRKIAKELGIKNASKVRKDELVEAIKNNAPPAPE